MGRFVGKWVVWVVGLWEFWARLEFCWVQLVMVCKCSWAGWSLAKTVVSNLVPVVGKLQAVVSTWLQVHVVEFVVESCDDALWVLGA